MTETYNNGYDVFVSCKSEDYHYGRMVYDYLIQKGVRVFLADTELRKQGIANYGNVIDTALESSKHLILVTTSANYAKEKFSPYVYYEWHTFSEEMRSGRKTGNIMTVVRDSSIVKSLPIALRNVQSFTFDDYQQVYNYVIGEKQPDVPDGPIDKIKKFVLDLRVGKNLGCAVTIVLFAFVGVVVTPILLWNKDRNINQTENYQIEQEYHNLGRRTISTIKRKPKGNVSNSSSCSSTVACESDDNLDESDTFDLSHDNQIPENSVIVVESDTF